MTQLEVIVESMNDPDINNDFRLFLTTAPSESFPISLLQDGIKMTMETKGDVKQMMLNVYGDLDESIVSSHIKASELKILIFSCALFHALVIDRKKYGSIGWNESTYDFSKEDFHVTVNNIIDILNS